MRWGVMLAVFALVGCSQQAVVSPAVVSPLPVATLPAMPPEGALGRPAGTVKMVPDARKFGPVDLGLTGIGTLGVGGRRYAFNWTEVNGRGFGSQTAPFDGQVFGLRTPEDFAGTYTPVAMAADGHSVLVRNEIGVSQQLSAPTSFVGVTSLTVRLTR